MEHSAVTVSILIPCFNLGAFLEEAVASALAQTFEDFEVLIVDDGSTDAQTVAVVDALERGQVRTLRTPHRGLAQARNYLLSQAGGKYVCFLDADDKLHPEFLARTVAVLERDAGVSFVSCWLDMFGEETGRWSPQRCDFPMLLAECTVCTAALVRRAHVSEVGGFDAGMPHQGYEDWDMWISLVENGHSGAILPEVLFFYRRRPDSMSVHCCSPSQHATLVRYLIHKHAASYEEHIIGVLMHKEAEAAQLLRANLAAERQLATYDSPLLEARRQELDRLKAKLSQAEERRGRHLGVDSDSSLRAQESSAQGVDSNANLVHEELQRAYAEVRALRSSWSWKLTAPLRAVVDMMRASSGR